MIANMRDMLAHAKQTKLLGEVVSWNCSKACVSHTDLVNALESLDLPISLLADLPVQAAFRRACRVLGQKRLVRALEEDSESITFQFTLERREGGYFTYQTEAKLTVAKGTGKVCCELQDLEEAVQRELDAELTRRRGSDIGKVLVKLIDQNGGLFPIRPQGGCYFIAQEHLPFLEKLESFAQRLGCTMARFPVPAGTREGDRSVKDTIAHGLATLVNEYMSTIDAFGADTREATFEKAASQIQQARFKVEAYSSYLEDERSRLDDLLVAASERLREKVSAIAVGV
jgi:hypothetical protein